MTSGGAKAEIARGFVAAQWDALAVGDFWVGTMP